MLEFTQNVFFCAYWLYFDSKYDDFTHGSHFESWLMAIKNYFISSLTWKSIGKISYICIHILTSTSTLLKRIFWVFFHCGTIDIIISYKGCTSCSDGKESTCQCRRPEFDPWVGKIPWSRERLPTQYSCLQKSTDRGAWQATVHGVTKSQTRLSN